MLALRWIEENITRYRESKAPTVEAIHAIDYSRRLELFETACKVFAVPMEVTHVWRRMRFFSRFRATLTSWLYAVAKNHLKKHQKEYRQLLAEIGQETFSIMGLATGWKGIVNCLEIIPRQGSPYWRKNVSLSLHHSFCPNREPKAKKLPSQRRKLQEQKENRCGSMNN